MQRHFEEELKDLKNDILKMGGLVEESIQGSLEALTGLDCRQAERIVIVDKIIDETELRIDEKCLDLLALQQPLAHDLRFITMAMKITTDLERIADLSVDIAQRVLEICNQPLLKPLIDIPKLARLAQQMTHDAITSFIEENPDLATKVITLDKEADELRNLVQSELINDYILKDKTTISRAIPLLLIARHLERICDHTTNIAEDIIYMVEAKVVKHHPEKL